MISQLNERAAFPDVLPIGQLFSFTQLRRIEALQRLQACTRLSCFQTRGVLSFALTAGFISGCALSYGCLSLLFRLRQLIFESRDQSCAIHFEPLWPKPHGVSSSERPDARWQGIRARHECAADQDWNNPFTPVDRRLYFNCDEVVFVAFTLCKKFAPARSYDSQENVGLTYLRIENMHEVVSGLDVPLDVHKQILRAELVFEAQVESLREAWIIAPTVVYENLARHVAIPPKTLTTDRSGRAALCH